MENTELLARLQQADSPEAGAILRDMLQMKIREAICSIIEEEASALCGPKYAPNPDSQYKRGGSTVAKVKLENKQVKIRRPRVRQSLGDHTAEVHLASWKAAKDPEQWEQAMYRAVLCGVSTRSMQRLHESELKGLSASAVSRLWAEKSRSLLQEMQTEDLSKLGIAVLMVDGIYLCQDLCCIAAIGIDSLGSKHVLGFKVGSSENAEVCADLLSDLHRRGLRPLDGTRFLAILDGSDALKSAMLKIYPKTFVQRCLVHKERNIRSYLSKKHWGELARLFSDLRKAQGKDAAVEKFSDIESFLSNKNAEALKSLKEAGSDVITLFCLEVPSTLNRSLLSTNAIENAFLNLRRHIGRVCRWRANTDQAPRWLASGLFLAQKTFHRIQGCDDMPKLIAALHESSAQPRSTESSKAA